MEDGSPRTAALPRSWRRRPAGRWARPGSPTRTTWIAPPPRRRRRSGRGPRLRSRSARACCAGPARSSRRTPASCATGSIRETGAVPGLADFAVGVATQECYEAAALAHRPAGEILQSNQPRLSLLRRVPVGVVGVISPFNVPLILSIRSVAPALALGNAVVLKPDLRTPISGGFAIARVFEEAGLPAGLLHVLPGGSAAGEALVDRPAGTAGLVHRVQRHRPPGGGARGRAPQAGAPRARRQLGDRRARRRRPRPRRLGRRLGDRSCTRARSA